MGDWYYRKSGLINDSTIGPIDEETLFSRIERGELALDTPVSGETTKGQWILLQSFPAMVNALQKGETDRARESEKKKELRRQEAEQRKKEKLAERERRLQEKQREAPPPVQQAVQQVPQQLAQPQLPQQPYSPTSVHVHVPDQPRSNTVPVLLNFLCPGVGQLVQGRVLPGVLFLTSFIISLVLCIFIVGFILAPIVWFIALIDSACARYY